MTSLPFLGVGLSYRWQLNPSIARATSGLDWLEVTPEHFMPARAGGDGDARLAMLARRFPLAGHSLELSIGADGGCDAEESAYRDGLRSLLGAAKARWHGDHVCFTRVGDIPLRALTPLPFTDDAVDVAAANVRAAQRGLDVPFIVENVAYYFDYPTSTMDEAEFLSRVTERADCGLLLDLHNVLVNAKNRAVDPFSILARLPLDRVVQIHLAGGEDFGELYLDSHSRMCPDLEWEMLEYVAPKCPVRGVNFEMDSAFPTFERLVEELAHARAILARCGAERA